MLEHDRRQLVASRGPERPCVWAIVTNGLPETNSGDSAVLCRGEPCAEFDARMIRVGYKLAWSLGSKDRLGIGGRRCGGRYTERHGSDSERSDAKWSEE